MKNPDIDSTSPEPSEPPREDDDTVYSSTRIIESKTDGGASTSSHFSEPEGWIGKQIGKYSVTGALGQGGMGVVLKGHDPVIDRDVAIKLLPAEFSSDETALNRFLSEARAAGKLTHPNVVQIYEVGQEGSNYFLVMEFVSGGSVNDLLEKRGPVSVFEATRILSDACLGLGAAHAAGLVHRDIKPANLLRTKDGVVKVTDFGIVKEAGAHTHQVTRAGTVVGTPYFMSPEQCEGRPVDARSDLYSLGATYYSLLTGAHPYEKSSSLMQVMYAHCHHQPPDPRDINEVIPPACSQIIAKAMAKSPDDRYQSAAEMHADLQAVLGALSGANTAYLCETAATKTNKTIPILDQVPLSTRRGFLIAGSLGAAAVLGGAGAFWWLDRQSPDAAKDSSEEASPAVAAPSTKNPILIGVLHSLSGTMRDSESAVVDATLFAIDEINAAGGLHGRAIKPLIVDGHSDPDRFAEEARKLIEDEKVVTVFGGWTSASRKTMKPVFEETDHLLVYPVQYEGLETSPNIFYMGSAPNQQILPALTWVRETLGKKRFFLVGSDYVFPRAAHAIMKDEIAAQGGEVVGEAFLPLGALDVSDVVRSIQETQPDLILNCINGDSNEAFFRALREAGITPDTIPTMSFSIGEAEMRNFSLDAVKGDYAAWTYFQSIDSPENRDFVDRFLERYPQRGITTDPMESAYTGVKLWAQAVADADDVTPQAIRRSMLRQRMQAPGGPTRIDADTQHCYKTPRIGRVRDDGQFDIVWEAPAPVEPEPYPASRTAADWKVFLHDLYTSWDKSWSAPATR